MKKKHYIKPTTGIIVIDTTMPLATSFEPSPEEKEEDADGAAAKTEYPSFDIWDDGTF